MSKVNVNKLNITQQATHNRRSPLSDVRRGDGDPVRRGPLHGVQHGDGGDALQVVRDGAAGLPAQVVLGGHGRGAAHQDDARVQERHEAELHHQVGDRRGGQPGRDWFARIIAHT